MDLATAVDRLYAAEPDEFVAVRTDLVKQARAAKDRELAKAIGALRKPTKSAWVINLLARGADDEVAGLLDLGAALREAQTSLSGPELRRLSGERATAVRALARRAAELAAEHDQTVTDAQLQEVSQHLLAALSDPALAEDVRAGRVTQIVTVGGFGAWEAGPPAAAPARGSEPTEPARTTAGRTGPDPKGSVAASDEPDEPAGPSPEELTAARDAWKRTRAGVAEAEAALAEAEQAAEAAAAEADRLRTELARAEQTATEAEAARLAADQAVERAKVEADEASQQLERLLD